MVSFEGLPPADPSLIRSGTERPYPRDLLNHPFIVRSESKNVNMTKWVDYIID